MKKLYNSHIKEAIHDDKNPFDYIKIRDIKAKQNNRHLYDKILDLYSPTREEVMAYSSNKNTIVAAAKRQMKAAPTPDPAVADDFFEYAKTVLTQEIGPYLKHFKYSYQQWYQHLAANKQKDMDLYAKYLTGHHEDLTAEQIERCEKTAYEGICKVELQPTDGKPRMVCAIPMATKYTMGPIAWALEEICTKHLRGYCGNKNLAELSQYNNKLTQAGFTTVVEGDGSAFDNTQDITLKRIDHWIYEQVEHAVYHVPKKQFHDISHQLYKTMDVCYIDPVSKKKKTAFQYDILGSVFSGDADTTLCNTIRMCLYNRYVNDKAGWIYDKDYVAYAKGDDFTARYQPYIQQAEVEQAYYKYFLHANPDPKQADRRVYGLGQILKMLDFGKPNALTFCSLRAWYTDEENIILTRNPAKFYTLGKYSRKIKTLRPLYKIAYLHNLGAALEINYPGITFFETVAKAYHQAAQHIQDTHQHVITRNKVYWKMAKKLRTNNYKIIVQNLLANFNQRQGEQRLQKTPYGLQEDITEQILYDIGQREEFYKIQGTYWETMSAQFHKAQYKLSDQQLARVNQQIEAEFSIEELKSLLGLINEH